MARCLSTEAVGKSFHPRHASGRAVSCCGVSRKPLCRNANLCATSFNLGGRNTSLLEFELEGDSSEIGARTTARLQRARQTLQDVREGPLAMPPLERAFIAAIMAEIKGEQVLESTMFADTQTLLDCPTWVSVLVQVKAHQPYLFNALNLATLQLNRPSVWENTGSCRHFTTALEYLAAWQTWYRKLDRGGRFWLHEAPRAAKKRNLDTATCFAGLLLYDVMCLCVARCTLLQGPLEVSSDDVQKVPFGEIAELADQLPASNNMVRHQIAETFIRGIKAQVIFAQEANNFGDHPGIAEAFLPVYALDGFTAVFLCRAEFTGVVDITDEVGRKMEALIDLQSPDSVVKAWRTTVHRLAAVRCRCAVLDDQPQVCLVSLHCSESAGTVAFIEALRSVLGEYDADLHILGMDANCRGSDADALQQGLRSSGFDVGDHHGQVTVAKQRTHMQTQVTKAGKTDVSHKDYIVSWGSRKINRGKTVYTPDLRTAYGVEHKSKQCVRLPTTQWPFDHCNAATSFTAAKHCGCLAALARYHLQSICSYVLVSFVLLVLLLPLMSTTRSNPLGPPGSWRHDKWPGVARVGLCEGEPPCAASWRRHEDSCYLATPRMLHEPAERFCRESGRGRLVSISSEAENEFVTAELCPPREFCWIGLYGDTSSKVHQWASGEPLNYSLLVGEQKGGQFLPLFPSSRTTDFVITVLSTWPKETCGCHRAESRGSPEDSMLFRLIGIGFSLLVSTMTLVLPRPPELLTSSYLFVSFIVKVGWFLSHMWATCFASSMEELAQGLYRGALLGGTAQTLTTWWAYWIILKRMNVLYPSNTSRVTLALLLMSWLSFAATNVLFIDYSTTLSADAIPVVAILAQVVVVILLDLLLSAPMTYNLYRTLAFMKAETTLGCRGDKEERAELSKQVRAAQLHLLCVSAAFMTGALRWSAFFAVLWGSTSEEYPVEATLWCFLAILADATTNDLCAYVLVAVRMDETLVRAKGISMAVARRAKVELEQHQDSEPFLILKSAVRAEHARIHQLMRCVRVRTMTMPLRYQPLIEIPVLHGFPRQHVPEEFKNPGSDYFEWLYAEAAAAQHVFFRQVRQLVAVFNRAQWPSDLGLASEKFPWKISASELGNTSIPGTPPPGAISPVEVLIHRPTARAALGCARRSGGTLCYVLEGTESHARVHLSGLVGPVNVPYKDLRKCRGGAVFVPGPRKGRQRCLDKIAADYEGREPWPAAASLLDICRCMIVLDDPYAIAVFVAYIRSQMKVLRVKNRFSEDVLESVGPQELQAMFYDCTVVTPSDRHSPSRKAGDWRMEQQQQNEYRDVNLSLEISFGPSAPPFVCEMQVTLSSLAVLKSADAKLYAISRMQRPEELRTVSIFTEMASVVED